MWLFIDWTSHEDRPEALSPWTVVRLWPFVSLPFLCISFSSVSLKPKLSSVTVSLFIQLHCWHSHWNKTPFISYTCFCPCPTPGLVHSLWWFSQDFVISLYCLSLWSNCRCFPAGVPPCCFCEAGEEAQNSGPGAQRLGYHHRHGSEGKHLHGSHCELKPPRWLVKHGCIFQLRCDGKKKTPELKIGAEQSPRLVVGSSVVVFSTTTGQISKNTLHFLSRQTQPVVRCRVQRCCCASVH